MTRINRLIVGEVMGPFLGGVGMFTTLFFAADGLQRIADYLQRGESAAVILQVVLYTLPTLLPYTIPMAMLLGALLAFGRLSGDSEIVAMLAAGVSFPRIVVPAVLFAAAIALPIVWLNQKIVPELAYARQAVIDNAKARGGGSTAGRNAFDVAVTNPSSGRMTVHAEGGVSFDDKGRGVLNGVTITLWDDTKPVVTVAAQTATWKLGTRNWLLDGGVTSFDHNSLVGMRTADTRLQEVTLGTPEDLRALSRPVIEQVTDQLRKRAQVRRKLGQEMDAREAEVEIARRTAFPLATIVFVLLGAPLGLQPRRAGKSLGFGLSVLLTFGYWSLLQLGMSIGKGGALPPDLAVQLPNIIGVITGIVLIKRVAS